jgi:hypothetical protein
VLLWTSDQRLILVQLGLLPSVLIPVASRNSTRELDGEIDNSPKCNAILSVYIEPAKPNEHTDPQIPAAIPNRKRLSRVFSRESRVLVVADCEPDFK